MVLGNRGGAWIDRLGRCLVIWASGTVVLGVVARVVWRAAAAGWADRGSLATLALDRALADLAAGVLLGCAAWGWLALTVSVVDALRGIRPDDVRRPARPCRLPDRLHRLVLTGCGVALLAGVAQPALAADGSQPHHRDRGAATLSGLPLPDRAVAPPRRPAVRRTSPSPRAITGTFVVRAGDCLWSIAARGLPAGATPAAVATRWHAIYAANRAAIGPDPDVVEPGQRLLLPRSLPRKDS